MRNRILTIGIAACFSVTAIAATCGVSDKPSSNGSEDYYHACKSVGKVVEVFKPDQQYIYVFSDHQMILTHGNWPFAQEPVVQLPNGYLYRSTHKLTGTFVITEIMQ